MHELEVGYYFEDINEFIFSQIFREVIYPWEALQKSDRFLKDLQCTQNSEINGAFGNTQIHGWVSIGEGTKIEQNVYIEGPAVIGKNCAIKQGVLIRQGTIISDNCVLGHGCEIKNSLVFNNAKIQSLTFVGDSIIGKGARIGSGTITANRRFDQENIGIKHGKDYLSFKRDFFGCVLGDYSRLGANAVTLPGTHIGPYTWIMPLTRISGFIPRGQLVSSEQKLIFKDNLIKKLK